MKVSSRMLGWMMGAVTLLACETKGDDASTSADQLRREGELADSSDVFDESQCEAILKAATQTVKQEAMAAAPKRLLLHVKDIQCLAYETQMRDRLNAQGERTPNPYDVLLPQLFAAARLGSKAGFGGTIAPPPPTNPGRPACLDAFDNLRGIDVSVAPAVQERQVCYTFGRALQTYLATRGTVKAFLERQIRINVVAEGAPVFDEVLGVMQLPWNYDENAFARALVSKPSFLREMYDVRIGSTGTYTSGAYQNNQNNVALPPITIPGRIAELQADFGEVVKLRVRVAQAEFEGCYDYVTIKDASDRALKRVCSATGGDAVSAGATFDLPLAPSYKVSIFSDGSNTGNGARLEWSVVLP